MCWGEIFWVILTVLSLGILCVLGGYDVFRVNVLGWVGMELFVSFTAAGTLVGALILCHFWV